MGGGGVNFAARGACFFRKEKAAKSYARGLRPLENPLNDGGCLFCARGTVCLASRLAGRL